MSDSERLSAKREKASRISANAFVRLLALQQEEMLAARIIREGDSYCDFFVEGAGPAWHEAFEDVITGDQREKVSQLRMAYVDRLRAVTADEDGYCDFFVEGGGPPWHEAFEDVITPRERLASDPFIRAQALSRLKVMDAYGRLRSASD